MLIVAGTSNPTKLAGIKQAFKDFFPNSEIEVVGVSVDNRVGPQPLGIESIYVGARCRALNSMKSMKGDFYVGVEAGLVNIDGFWIDVHVAYITDGRAEGIGLSMGFEVPQPIARAAVYEETELDQVVDSLFGTRDIGSHGGVIKILTKGRVDRSDLVRQAVLMGLLPWVNPQLYKRSTDEAPQALF
ncbi:MAG: inosine/xanthosine triphosphatase [Crenarchaeota archaeon]|nr:inosine/xanthosine triphosphatase [Thermoproteota archaeon]